MSQTWFHKPENALKRANELITIGNKSAALELLHNVFAARRYKTWQKAYETIMLKYLDLCVELQNHRQAKDGLHQYRNLCLQQAPQSLEIIIEHLVTVAEQRAAKARKAANDVALKAAASVSDLEQEVSPESIMLSTMTEDGEKERTDREVVVPWLKFLWETYRAVLDILKTNSKLENVYHNTCIKAFHFCRTYERKTEFKRLCETLRQHISNLQKHQGAASASRLRGWEGWTNESVELHLTTRFYQLEVAAQLELWTEGFRTVEDIYNIMQIGKKQPKARLMASYYEKLTRIFWVSDNRLFHAYAWYRFYSLSREFNKALTAEERVLQASSVLLATLSIPQVQAGNAAAVTYEDDDLAKEKNQRMATLLGFNTDPSRANLLLELNSKGLLSQVSPELRQLYDQLENTFHPLSIVSDVKPLLDHLSESGEQLAQYVVPLEHIVVLRLLEQLSQIYHTVSLDKFEKYVSRLSISFQEVEKIIVRAVKARQLKVSVDHLARCLRFGHAEMETEAMRTQLSSLARQLDKVGAIINGAADQSSAERERLQLFDLVASSIQGDHTEALGRKDIIEKRKEDQERREHEKQREAARIKAEEEAKRREEESRRLDREARLREKEKLQKIEDKMALDETKQMLARLGKKVDDSSVWEGMNKTAREELIRKTKDEAKKAKEEEERRVKEQAKRLDYMTRSLRLEEMPVLKEKNAKLVEADLHAWEVRWAEHLVQHRLQHEKHKLEAQHFKHMQPWRSGFEDTMRTLRKEVWEMELHDEEERVRENHRRMKIQRALKRRNDAILEAEREREEKEREERDAEERARREAEQAVREAERLRREEEDAERRRNQPEPTGTAAADHAGGWRSAMRGAGSTGPGIVPGGGGGSGGGFDRDRESGAAPAAVSATRWRRQGAEAPEEGGGGREGAPEGQGVSWRRGGGGGAGRDEDSGGGGPGARRDRDEGGFGRRERGDGGFGRRDYENGASAAYPRRGRDNGGASGSSWGVGGDRDGGGGSGAAEGSRWRREAGAEGNRDGAPLAGQRPKWGLGRRLADLEK